MLNKIKKLIHSICYQQNKKISIGYISICYSYNMFNNSAYGQRSFTLIIHDWKKSPKHYGETPLFYFQYEKPYKLNINL